jgi:UDPglucose 6-dehydrogenase
MNGKKTLSVIGCGHVGLVTAVCFASRGYSVVMCEKDDKTYELLRKGAPSFYEPGLASLLDKQVCSGMLQASQSAHVAIASSEIVFVSVGTPSKPDGGIDLRSIEASCAEIGEALRSEKSYRLIVIRSTVIPGTTEDKLKPIIEKHSEKNVGRGFGLVMQPEFLREGSAIEDTLAPDRIVIGEYDRKSGDILESLYMQFYKGNIPPILRMNLASAEMVKYASNAFLATKISFMNHIANICEKIKDVDVRRVAEAMGLDDRIGRKFLNAGPGFGGACFEKDVNALVAFCRELGCDPGLLPIVLNINKKQALHMVELAKRELGCLERKRVAILGLSFKPNTDDMREAPSIRIIDKLLEERASVTVYDPMAMTNARAIYQNKVKYASSPIDCISNADCAIIVTEWNVFKELKLDDFKNSMRKPLLIDARRIYESKEFGKPLNYFGIGLGPPTEQYVRPTGQVATHFGA